MSTKRAIQYWVIPPEADAEFVAHMEDVLDVYFRPACTPCQCYTHDVTIVSVWLRAGTVG